MTTAHSHEVKPDSMTSRIPWLLIVLGFALLAALLWYYGGHTLAGEHAAQHHGH